MAKILKRRIKWNPVTAEDVTGYKVYYLVGGVVNPEDVNYDLPSKSFSKDTLQAIIPDDIPELAGVDGDVTVAITAFDDIGNESDFTVVTAPFDFAAPDAPTGVVVEAF